MSYSRQVLSILLIYLLFYINIRWIIASLKDYYYNNSSQKKIKKTETFKERFFYKKYPKIPKIFIVLHNFVLVIHPIALILCVVFNHIEQLNRFAPYLVDGLLAVNSIWIIIIFVMFWSPTSTKFRFDRWLKK